MKTRQRNKLTAKQVQALKEPGKYSDGGGLYLVIDRSGKKRWAFIFRWNGRQPEMGLGVYPVVQLADARAKALDAERLVRSGVNPIESRQASSNAKRGVPTFGELADQVIDSMIGGFRNDKHIYQWEQTLGDAYCKTLRPKLVSDIKTDDVLDVLRPIWLTKSETAKRLRARIEKVLDAAKVKGYRSEENPARWKGHLSAILPKPNKAKRHQRALSYNLAPSFWVALSAREATAADAFRFLILNATRVTETLKATWDQIDFNARTWTIPAANTKTAVTFTVPLSDAAIEVLIRRVELRSLFPDSPYVFPGFRDGKPLSNMAFKQLLERMGQTGFVPHGFRSTFRDWAGDCTDHSEEVTEQALNHKVGSSVRRAYRRMDGLEKRRALMNDWSNYLTGVKSPAFLTKVVNEIISK